MLPSENSLTYTNDLIEHYRAVDQRIRTASSKPTPVQPEPVEPQPPPPILPPPVLPDEMEVAFAELADELRAKILTPHVCTRIINETCLEHGISREEMVGQNRAIRIVRTRHLAMWRCRQAGVSLPTIGRYFGNRDHTTVLNAVRKIDRERA